MKHTDIKTFEDACKVLDHDSTNIIPDFSIFPEHHQKAMVAHAKLILIFEAVSKIMYFVPNWNDSDQIKYYPWFEMSDAGFDFADCHFRYSLSFVGSRLCTKDSISAEFIGKQFVDLYRDYFLLEVQIPETVEMHGRIYKLTD